MNGYVLADVSWANEEDRQAYLELLGPSLEAHRGVTITVSEDVRVMEGSWRPGGVFVLISFPSKASALTWYDSQEYRPALEIRKRSSASRLLIFGE